jgi:hypothetical protein
MKAYRSFTAFPFSVFDAHSRHAGDIASSPAFAGDVAAQE